MEQAEISNIPVWIARKNIKNFYIRIKGPNADVYVSVPKRASQKKIDEFLNKNANWIIKKRKDRLQISDTNLQYQLDSKKFVDGEELFLWGKPFRLKIIESSRWSYEIDNNNSKFLFYATPLSSHESKLKHLKVFYKEILLDKSQAIFNKYCNLTGLFPEQIKVRFTKSVWGTCNKKKKIILLNGQLACFDEQFLDYVVLHEIAHLKYANHGDDFKDFLSNYLPNWKEIRFQLNNAINLGVKNAC